MKFSNRRAEFKYIPRYHLDTALMSAASARRIYLISAENVGLYITNKYKTQKCCCGSVGGLSPLARAHSQ